METIDGKVLTAVLVFREDMRCRCIDQEKRKEYSKYNVVDATISHDTQLSHGVE